MLLRQNHYLYKVCEVNEIQKCTSACFSTYFTFKANQSVFKELKNTFL